MNGARAGNKGREGHRSLSQQTRRGGRSGDNCGRDSGSGSDNADMAEFLTEEQIGEFRKAFSLFDNDGSDTISSRELIQVMQNLNLRPREEEIQYIIRKIDVDGGGSIDFSEFLGLMGRKMRDMKKDESAFNAFRLFDRDRNGYITAEELKYAMRRMGQPIDDKEARKIIREADRDGDRLLTYEEFHAKIMKK